jgi:4-hydroxybenzoate polyprenyltransferase
LLSIGIFVIGLVSKRSIPWFIYFIVAGMLLVLFTVLEWVPVWFVLIFVAVLMLFIYFKLKGGSTNEEA